MVDNLDKLERWAKIQIPRDKRKYPNPRAHGYFTGLRHCAGEVRQAIMRDHVGCYIPITLKAPRNSVFNDDYQYVTRI